MYFFRSTLIRPSSQNMKQLKKEKKTLTWGNSLHPKIEKKFILQSGNHE